MSISWYGLMLLETSDAFPIQINQAVKKQWICFFRENIVLLWIMWILTWQMSDPDSVFFILVYWIYSVHSLFKCSIIIRWLWQLKILSRLRNILSEQIWKDYKNCYYICFHFSSSWNWGFYLEVVTIKPQIKRANKKADALLSTPHSNSLWSLIPLLFETAY